MRIRQPDVRLCLIRHAIIHLALEGQAIVLVGRGIVRLLQRHPLCAFDLRLLDFQLCVSDLEGHLLLVELLLTPMNEGLVARQQTFRVGELRGSQLDLGRIARRLGSLELGLLGLDPSFGLQLLRPRDVEPLSCSVDVAASLVSQLTRGIPSLLRLLNGCDLIGYTRSSKKGAESFTETVRASDFAIQCAASAPGSAFGAPSSPSWMMPIAASTRIT